MSAADIDALLERVADSIRDVGARARDARRYRDLATTLADPTFDRVLDIGSAVRRAARGPEPAAVIEPLLRELEALDARCLAALDDLRRSEAYQETVASFRAGDVGRVAARAPALFTDVTPYTPEHPVYWPVPLGSGRSGPHFAPPEETARRIVLAATDGLPAPATPPDLGGDDAIAPVLLSDDPDLLESPIALVYDSAAIPGPLCRITGDTTILFYAERLCASPRVECRATVEDEWWRTQPDLYREYVDGLRRALETAGLATTLTVVG